MLLDERKFRPVGSLKWEKLNAGIIFATNRDLEYLVNKERFRKDLYHRIRTCSLYIPPSRDRINTFKEIINSICENRRLRRLQFSKEAMVRLREHIWEGNVRELEYYLVMWASMGMDHVDVEHLPDSIDGKDMEYNLDRAIAKFKRSFIMRVLTITDWNINEAARKLGITRQHLHRLINEFDLKTFRGK